MLLFFCVVTRRGQSNWDRCYILVAIVSNFEHVMLMASSSPGNCFSSPVCCLSRQSSQLRGLAAQDQSDPGDKWSSLLSAKPAAWMRKHAIQIDRLGHPNL